MESIGECLKKMHIITIEEERVISMTLVARKSRQNGSLFSNLTKECHLITDVISWWTP